jgi:hypothetical protein
MPETYNVTSHSISGSVINLNVAATTPIPPTPVSKIKVYVGSQQSYEREVSPRRADVYFSSGKWNNLKTHLQAGATVRFFYNATSIPNADDPISSPDFSASYS